MKIEETKVRKLHVTDVYKSHGLDPIHVYLEDYEPRKGKITISSYDKAWHSYWGGMGDRTIAEFFLSCDNHYIAKNLSSIRSTINDYKTLGEKIKSHYGDDIDFFLNDEIESMSDEHISWQSWLLNEGNETMTDVFGGDWFYDIPTKENPQYKYLCRVIDLTKEALKTIEQ